VTTMDDTLTHAGELHADRGRARRSQLPSTRCCGHRVDRAAVLTDTEGVQYLDFLAAVLGQ
jgi:hypothetical protein